jgi:hypothetical protein
MLEGLKKAVSEFPSDLKEILTTPKTLTIFIVGLVVLLFTASSWNLFIFTLPVMFFFGALGWRAWRDKREGYKLGWKRAAVLVIDAIFLISIATYGYEYTVVNDIDIAVIPGDLLSKNQWARDRSQDNSSQMAWGLLRYEMRGYQYNDANLAEPPYPGEVWVITVKTVVIPGDADIQKFVEQKIGDIKKDGLTIDTNNGVHGSESLGNGERAHYILYEAYLVAGGGGAFINFATGAKIKIKVEWYTCEEHGTVIVGAGAAQWGSQVSGGRLGNIILGPQPDDMRTWDGVNRLLYGINCA